MRVGTTGDATLRHVGLVALEALLVAAIVWVAAMSLAGATQSGGGIVGAAAAGGDAAAVSVADARFGQTVVATVRPGEPGSWVHVTCIREGSTVSTQWAAVDADHRVTLSLDRPDRWTGGSATCTAEEGYFQSNGRWRVLAATAFVVRG
jgi:hypothetical protein